jgi:hypothetical protein
MCTGTGTVKQGESCELPGRAGTIGPVTTKNAVETQEERPPKKEGGGFSAVNKERLREVARDLMAERGWDKTRLAREIDVGKQQMKPFLDEGKGINPESALLLCEKAGVDFMVLVKSGEKLKTLPSVRTLPGFNEAMAANSSFAQLTLESAIRAIDAVGVAAVTPHIVEQAALLVVQCRKLKAMVEQNGTAARTTMVGATKAGADAYAAKMAADASRAKSVKKGGAR